MLKTSLKFIARITEKSKPLQEFVRKTHFKGKVVTVSEIDSKYLPQGDLVEEVNGIKYKFNLADDIQKYIYFNVYERREMNMILPLISEGSVCMDVGANVGFYALNFAKRIGSNGKVYAFEASPTVATRLKENCSLNSFGNRVKIQDWAVSSKEGEVSFSISAQSNSGWGHIGNDARFEKISVKTNTLDNFFKEERVEKVDFMKVDIEGAEDDLMEGAKAVLSEKRIRYIFMEFCKMEKGEVKNRVNRFAEFGYAPVHEEEKLRKMQEGVIEPRDIIQNFLFEAK
jgi:FkbM family methyltransferase